MPLELPNEIFLPVVSDFLSKGKEVELKATGNSMLPYIHSGKDSVVLVRKPQVEVGDMVLAEIAPTVYVLHRVYAVNGNQVTLMGDGNVRGTEHCRLTDVKGTVKEIITSNNKHRPVGRGRLWRRLLPVRRYLLAIYRRLP